MKAGKEIMLLDGICAGSYKDGQDLHVWRQNEMAYQSKEKCKPRYQGEGKKRCKQQPALLQFGWDIKYVNTGWTPVIKGLEYPALRSPEFLLQKMEKK